MTELNASEQAAVTRYIELVQQRLGHQLETVWLYGSAARDDMWPTDSPMHSDIDVLVVTSESVTQDQVDQLVNDTYPLYLECGRQISPAFKTAREWRSEDDKAEFVARVRDEGRQLWPQPRNDLAPSTGGPALPSKRRAGFREAMPHHAPHKTRRRIIFPVSGYRASMVSKSLSRSTGEVAGPGARTS